MEKKTVQKKVWDLGGKDGKDESSFTKGKEGPLQINGREKKKQRVRDCPSSGKRAAKRGASAEKKGRRARKGIILPEILG